MKYKLMAVAPLVALIAAIMVAIFTAGCSTSGLAGPTTITPTLTRIVILGDSTQTVRLGATLQLTAWGYFSDGTDRDITSEVDWTSSLPGVLAVDGTVHKGLVSTHSVGSSRVFAVSIRVAGLTTSVMVVVSGSG